VQDGDINVVVTDNYTVSQMKCSLNSNPFKYYTTREKHVTLTTLIAIYLTQRVQVSTKYTV